MNNEPLRRLFKVIVRRIPSILSQEAFQRGINCTIPVEEMNFIKAKTK